MATTAAEGEGGCWEQSCSSTCYGEARRVSKQIDILVATCEICMLQFFSVVVWSSRQPRHGVRPSDKSFRLVYLTQRRNEEMRLEM